ncbi:dephospho-CoA kinase [Candidatus Pelagibacter sp.]|uniref:dephospho-CoA kinase n=1 Tax=Candidatus Pelagibacter sp. TaxID=2024849 RepID=UPI003F8637EA
MKRIGILGDIGSGKTYIAKCFGFPVFNADLEVAKIYKHDRKVFQKLKKELPNYFSSFPLKKKEIINAILSNRKNLKRIIKIVHREVRKKMNDFLTKNKHKKFVVLDIPLLLENKINKKKDILVFVEAKKLEILKRLKKRKNFNMEILNNFKKMQLSLVLKKKKSQFIIKNNFKKNSVKVRVKEIIKNLV